MVNLETTDLFRGAFLLCMGGDLAGVRVRSHGKRIATFLITGKDLGIGSTGTTGRGVLWSTRCSSARA